MTIFRPTNKKIAQALNEGGDGEDQQTFICGWRIRGSGIGSHGRGSRAEKVRRRCDRQGDQDRPHQSIQRAGLFLRRHRQVRGSLLEERQRARRDQRAHGEVRHHGRRLQPGQDRRGGSPDGGAGQGPLPVQHAGHADKLCDPSLHEPEEGAAALRVDRRFQVGQVQGVPLDDGLPARLPHRSRHLCQAHPRDCEGPEDRRADAERRLRQGLLGRLQGGTRQGRQQGGEARHL